MVGNGIQVWNWVRQLDVNKTTCLESLTGLAGPSRARTKEQNPVWRSAPRPVCIARNVIGGEPGRRVLHPLLRM